MSGSTTELSLATAVDSDDNADYLTIALANSLRTVDALFNNVTGHNHGGAHQGGQITASAIPSGTITSTMIADGTIQTVDLADGSVTSPKLGGNLVTPGTLQTTGDLYVYGGSTAIHFGDASHYLQYAPAGAATVLRWTHDLESGGYLKTGSGRILSSFSPLQFMDNGGGSLINLQANDLNCQSLSLLQGSNQVIYWRDASHYLQYAPAGQTTILAWTHDLQAGAQLKFQGGYSYFTGDGSSAFCRLNSAGGWYFQKNGGGAYADCYGLSFQPQSARKSKTDIATLADPLGVVMDERVHGVRYTDIASGDRKIGFVADDWVPVEGSVVGFDNNDEVMALDYDRIGAITFEALKQYVIATNARLDALERKVV